MAAQFLSLFNHTLSQHAQELLSKACDGGVFPKESVPRPLSGVQGTTCPMPETARTAGRSEQNAAQRAAFFLLLLIIRCCFPRKTGSYWVQRWVDGCYPYPQCKGGTQGAHAAHSGRPMRCLTHSSAAVCFSFVICLS